MARLLPAELASCDALLEHLKVGALELSFLKRYAVHRYSYSQIPKRSGGVRTLLIPDKRLKFLQRKVLPLLEQIYSRLSPVHGFTQGRSAVTNAQEHQSRRFLLNVDLEDYFPTINRGRVKGVLIALGCDDDTADALCCFCVAGSQLPQGAPTSPILANMVTFKLDLDMLAFAARHKLRYTRYADDLTFSSHRPPVGLFEPSPLPPTGAVPKEQLSAEFRTIVSQNGFVINESKVWFSGVDGRKEVTGLVVNELINVRRTFVRNIRAGLFKAETLGVDAAEQDLQQRLGRKISLEQHLRGRIEWLAQVRGRGFSAYRTLAKRFNEQFPLSRLPVDPTIDEIVEKAVWVIHYEVGDELRQGTAFFLSNVGLVTCQHVVADLPVDGFAHLSRPGSKSYFAMINDRVDKTRDLAVMTHNVHQVNFYPSSRLLLRTALCLLSLLWGFLIGQTATSSAERPDT